MQIFFKYKKYSFLSNQNNKKNKIIINLGNNNSKDDFNINGEKLEKVTTFSYLGIIINRDGIDEEEMNIKMNKPQNFIFNKIFIGKRKVHEKAEMTIYKTRQVVRLVLTEIC